MPDRCADGWPLVGLRLEVEGVSLRPIVESDLDSLAAALPPDLEMNPHTPRPFGLADPVSRATALRQEYWTAMATWTPQSWRLPFVVLRDGRIVGYQDLEAEQFRALRTVETSSWLSPEHRGMGVGKLARTAVLALAFDGLAAEVALTEAWVDNAASLGVSASLGYRTNGSARHLREGVAVEMPRMRLDRADWLSRRRPSVEIIGLERCLPWFVDGHHNEE